MEKLIAGLEKLGLSLSSEQREKFEIYCREMLDWNQRINLTGIREYNEVQVKHFLDSLSLAPVLESLHPAEGFRLLDVGAGAGLPGIPLKIAYPEIFLVLLEATAKKTEFLRYAVSTLGMKNVEVVTGRAEEIARLGKYREKFDAVVSRAVAPLAVLAELTLPFCAPGGICVFPKKGDISCEIAEAAAALDILGGRLTGKQRVVIDELDDDRCLLIIEKVFATPAKYPRRPGIPEKRPL